MFNLIGVYECKIDAKGRLPFPAAFRKQLSEVLNDGFTMKRSVFHRFIELYPMCEWKVQYEKLVQINRFTTRTDDFIRILMAGAKTVELDPAGRLLIPKDLLEYSGIKKNIVVAAALDKIEIWDKDAYEQVVKYDPVEFEKSVEEIMGGSFNK